VHGRLLGDGRLVEPGGAVELASEEKTSLASPPVTEGAGVITAMRPEIDSEAPCYLASPEVVRLRQCHRDEVNRPGLDHAAAAGSLGTMIHIAR
jgi:hypothetical protein